MHDALFIPCYVDQFYPRAGIPTLELLEKLGCTVSFPRAQSCCGQPLANTGMEREARPIYEHFIETFADYEYVVCPSGSCVHHVKHHYDTVEQTAAVTKPRERTYELADFLVNVLQVTDIQPRFSMSRATRRTTRLMSQSPMTSMAMAASKSRAYLSLGASAYLAFLQNSYGWGWKAA